MTKIEWAEQTWNAILGCSIVSPGCTNCYAMKMAARIEAMGHSRYAGLTKPSKAGPVWTGKVAFVEGALAKPLKRKKPTTYFVNSMSDLFHEDVPDAWIDRVFAVMALSPQHTFQILTKRSARMRAYMSKASDEHSERAAGIYREASALCVTQRLSRGIGLVPYDNVWLGVSCEDQRRADERIPDLLATPAAVRFISAEPLLGPLYLSKFLGCTGMPDCEVCEHSGKRIDWVIVGGESGPGARPMDLDWARAIVDQCQAAGVACFVKQLGAVPIESRGSYRLRDRKGGDMAEWPEALRVREMPVARHEPAKEPALN